MRWTAAEPDVGSVLAEHPDPLASRARAEVSAIVLREAYEAEHCAALIDRFVARGLMTPICWTPTACSRAGWTSARA